MIRAGTDYGRSAAGAGKKVNVEFVSANRPVPCMSAIAAAPWWAMRSQPHGLCRL